MVGGSDLTTREWFYIAMPLGLTLCYVVYKLSRRFAWIGFISVGLFIIVVGWFPILFLTRAMGGSEKLALQLARVSILAAQCGALCAGLARGEENQRRRENGGAR
jgi:hypothetical protein